MHNHKSPAPRYTGHVTACVPYFRSGHYVRRAVLSLLEQTHRHITVVVVNDGDRQTPPWPYLANIDDPRLIRFELPRNQGLYFANALVAAAANTPYFLVQDADDWSSPQRTELLIQALEAEGTDFAFGAEVQFEESEQGTNRRIGVRYARRVATPQASIGTQLEAFCTNLDRNYRFRLTHHGLFRTSTLAALGGYYGGFRQHYDTLLTNLVLMAGRISHVPVPLYWRLHWPGALTKRPETGFGTETSENALAHGKEVYSCIYRSYQRYLDSEIDSRRFLGVVRGRLRDNIDSGDAYRLRQETDRLRQMLTRGKCGGGA